MAMAGNVTPTKPSYIRFVCDDCHTNTYWYEPDDGALGAFAQRGFEFRECHLDWVEVWRISGQIADCCANSRDCFAHPVDFVGPQIVHEYDVAFCQRRHEHLLDIGHECGSIHRTIDDIRCGQAADAQRRDERQSFPVAVRYTCDESLATRRTTRMTNHFGCHRRLINKDEPSRA